MAVNSSKPRWSPKIDVKNDPKQSTFNVPEDLLSCARSVFFTRYVLDIGTREDFSVSWTDEAIGNPPKVTKYATHSVHEIPESIPEELFRTKIAVTYRNLKLVTITVHYTTGSILVQGKKCREWRENEFQSLVDCIEAIGRSESTITKIENQIRGLPLPDEIDLRTSSRLKLKSDQSSPGSTGSDSKVDMPSPAPNPTDSSLRGPELSSSSAADHSLSLNPTYSSPQGPELSSSSAANHSLSAPKQSPPLDTNIINTEPNQSENCSLSTPSLEQNDSESQTLSAPNPKPSQSKDETPIPEANQSGNHSLAAPNPEANQTENHSISASNSQTNKTADSSSQTEAVYLTLKEVEDLIAGYISKIKIEHSDSEVRIKKELKLLADIKFNHIETSINSLNESVKSLEKGQHDVTSQVKELKIQKKVHVLHSSTQSDAPSSKPSPKQPSPLHSPVTNNVPHTPSGPAAPIPLSSPDVSLSSAAATEGQVIANPSSKAPTHTPQKKTPREMLAEKRVAPDTTHVILGDSVTTKVDPQLCFPKRISQNLSVAGITIEDMKHYLKNIPKQRNVKRIICHIGINSCWQGAILGKSWTDLIKLLKSVFPESYLEFSSIVPPCGGHTLASAAAASNDSLAEECARHDVHLHFHTPTFTTQSGAPRKALYRDQLHPSAKGTAKIAVAFKYANQPPVHTDNDRRLPSLEHQQGAAALSSPFWRGSPPSQGFEDRASRGAKEARQQRGDQGPPNPRRHDALERPPQYAAHRPHLDLPPNDYCLSDRGAWHRNPPPPPSLPRRDAPWFPLHPSNCDVSARGYSGPPQPQLHVIPGPLSTRDYHHSPGPGPGLSPRLDGGARPNVGWHESPQQHRPPSPLPPPLPPLQGHRGNQDASLALALSKLLSDYLPRI